MEQRITQCDHPLYRAGDDLLWRQEVLPYINLGHLVDDLADFAEAAWRRPRTAVSVRQVTAQRHRRRLARDVRRSIGDYSSGLIDQMQRKSWSAAATEPQS